MRDRDLEAWQSKAQAGTDALPPWYPAWRCMSIAVLAALLLLTAIASWAEVPASSPAASLRAQYTLMQGRLVATPFAQPLVLESKEASGREQGEIHAIVNYPFATVTSALGDTAHWCDILILHLNVKYCRPVTHAGGTALSVAIGRKYDQPLGDAFRLELDCRVVAAASDYVAVELESAKGPFGTTNYRITLEAVALAPGRSFLHLRYSYQYGLEAQLAMDAYLATGGSGKVGFTRVDAPDERESRYIGGVRGVVERNTMRYFLAIDAYLAALAAPPAQRLDVSLDRWYGATERYPRQLHEVDRETYLAMKRREYQRQQTPL